VKRKPKDQRNEGEGNRTAAAESIAAQRLVRPGKVEEKAREAAKTIEGKEREALKEAELVGRRHAAGDDPEVKR
jgi:hypothetical protein